MRRLWWPTLLLAGLIVSLALGGTDQEDRDRNRRLLERWRADPDHYQRLLRDHRAFYALPRARQEQLRQLDRQLHETDAVTQARLWSALERYNTWLETLSDEQRQQLGRAPDASARLALIRAMRLRQWLPRLPLAQQRVVAQLPAEQQPDRIATFRFEERLQREKWLRDWLKAEAAIPRPTRLDELPAAVRAHVEKELLPRLTASEQQRLRLLEGKYADWLRQLHKLAETHPIYPPGPRGEIKNPKDLPSNVAASIRKLDRSKKKGLVKAAIGKWPEYALQVQLIALTEGIPCPPLGASKPAEFPPEIQNFLTRQLIPVLTPAQKVNLERLEGRWPEYPKLLLVLARDKRLIIPGMSLPGPIEMWESARARLLLPEAPERMLSQFINVDEVERRRQARARSR